MSPSAITAESVAEAWWHRLRQLVETGQEVSPRGRPTREHLAVQIIVNDAQNNILVHPDRNLSYRFMVAEFLWIASGSNDVESIARYNDRIREFSDDGVTFAGAYGPRLLLQLPYLTSVLVNNPETRQAVATIWTPTPGASKDIPCTVSFQALLRDNHLHGIVTMRSSDVWLGLPYDLYNFSMILAMVANAVNAHVGSLTFNLGSSHLYETDLERAKKVLDNHHGLGFVRSGHVHWMSATQARITLTNPSEGSKLGKVLLAGTNKEALTQLIANSDLEHAIPVFSAREADRQRYVRRS